ncbi:MAG: PEP-CTERM sorting domain-containing protein [Phycisphaerae bacterium]|nr:PEP-CTERM sorting domain-containing protein [Phycisphaerae bacterium]
MTEKGVGARVVSFIVIFFIVLLVAGNQVIALNPPTAGAVILSHTPEDYNWWNGCSPTAAGMLFGWWEEEGHDAFPGNHRNVPSTYNSTSTNPAHYEDARGIIAGWAHKQEGINQGLSYGSHDNHIPDSIADFMLTHNSSTSPHWMPHSLETFGAWDDRRTSEIESRSFRAVKDYSLTYSKYCNQIDAGRPVFLGLTATNGSSMGHSVLGVGYNNTDGKQSYILNTTWGWGLQEWDWVEEQQTSYRFEVSRGVLVNAVTTPVPELSAYLSIAHDWAGDLTVVVGVGDPDNPDWSTTVWIGEDRGGYKVFNQTNLVLTDIDCTAVLDDYLAGDLEWFLKVTDDNNQGGTSDAGFIVDFQIRHNFDEFITFYGGGPVAIDESAPACVSLGTVPEPATISLLILGGSALLTRRRRRNG